MLGLRTGLLSFSVALLFVSPLFADIAPFPIRTAWPRPLVPHPAFTVVAGLFLSAAIVLIGLRLQRSYSPRIVGIAAAIALLVVAAGAWGNVRSYSFWQRWEQRPRGPLPPRPEPPDMPTVAPPAEATPDNSPVPTEASAP